MILATPLKDLRKGDRVYYITTEAFSPRITSEELIILAVNPDYRYEKFRGHVTFDKNKGGMSVNPDTTHFFRVKPKLPTEPGSYILVDRAISPKLSYQFNKGAVARFDGTHWNLFTLMGDSHGFRPEEIAEWSPVTITKGR